MRFPRNNFSNMTMGHPQDDNEADQALAEARRAEEIAQRRAYLEQKIFQAREAKRRAAEAQAQQASQQPSQPQAPVPNPDMAASQQHVRQTTPLVPPLVPAEAVVAPDWQRAFSLAPNVRFTRTPESQIPRRNVPDPRTLLAAKRAEALRQSTQVQPAETPVPAVEVQPNQAASLPDSLAGSSVPQPSYVPADVLPPELTPRPMEAGLEFAAPVPEVQSAISLAGVLATEASNPVSRLANLSDFAFWDVMPFDESFAPIPEAPFIAPPHQIAPRIEIAPESILSLYRIIEWHHGLRQSVDIPVLPQVVAEPVPVPSFQPVQAEAIPVVAPEPMIIQETAPQPVIVAPPVVEPIAIAAPAPAPLPPQPTVQDVAPVAESPIVAAQPASVVSARLQPPPARRDRPVAPAPMEWRPVAVTSDGDYQFPPRELLQEPVARTGVIMTQETLEQNAGLLESVLEDFGVKGEIIHVRPGPVVTLYEFEPAPGVKSSRVIGLADDIARSMSALSARVAVVPGRNVIGIELPNALRETVYFRELIDAQSFESTEFKLALCLGKNIGGEPIIAELAKMPHLLVAGTTGSGKSVAINTMILSLLYRLTPEQCRLIMVDPKMLELSVYDGIPHLLTPVVTDPKKAVMALKWAVREMEDRYRKMSRLGVRNIDGYNSRVRLAREKDETINVVVQTGFDKGTGAPIEESQEMDLTPMPYIVVIVDEMADLMMVAGKEIEGAIQRLAQMARAAGIHLIMATQRPSVDVITGTIKANFPTRISFQVTSKIDSRTILGEQGAEQLLGQGDMLHMAGGGRISRVHGPFVSDEEVEKVVAHLKTQGRPEYLDTVTAGEDEEDDEDEGDSAVFDKTSIGSEDGDDLYEQAIKVVMRDKKCSTSYIQRRLGIGYNRAASLVERMEKDGLVGPANHVGKREIISGNRDAAPAVRHEDMD
ncbi:DNA translocase FtsK [Neorhizobium sp. P12A]|uniref:DNA translocase FtsK n=1 Tax=Rhizobium/Agrobacterium group TaxID=227290 RepID=UPI0010461245|nr:MULTISPECIES: DNA translocase FtsK [Rhizobium/Agrobacterium group]KAA0699702.1 DNA translocase FtsK [Neorhizobium sp. P12A]TCR91335.1 DNA translocase FtsK [Rhizobium sp. BK376]